MSRRGRGVPLVAVLLALVAVAFFVLPLSGCCSARRGATSGTTSASRRRATRSGSRSSARCGRPLFSLLFGVPLAYVLARARFPGRALVRALVVLPMVLPPVVGGVALLYAFQRNDGLVGGWLYDCVRTPAHVLDVGRGPGRDVRGDAVPRHHGRGRAALDGPALRGRGREPRRRPLDGVPPGDRADDRARRSSPAPRWRGRARSGSSARRSPSPATSRAARRRRRSRSTSCSSRNQGVAIALSLVLLAVSIVVLVVAARPLVRRPA